MNVRKEQRKINPYQILIFSERQVNHSNCVSLPLNGEGNLIKSRFALKSSVVKLNAVVFKKSFEMHYNTRNQKPYREARSLLGLSGESSLAQYRTILNHTDR